jgi:hypothetical protein
MGQKGRNGEKAATYALVLGTGNVHPVRERGLRMCRIPRMLIL